MLGCKFSSSIFDIRELVNYITCFNKVCERYGSLVNSHQCANCPHKQLVEVHRYAEGPFSKLKSDEIATKIVAESCSQCSNYDAAEQTCQALHTSQIILEFIKHPDHICPRGLW